MNVAIHVAGSADLLLARELEAKSIAAGAKVFGVVRRFGLLLQSQIVAGAQGRPGPRRRSGDYIRSWNTLARNVGTSAVADVGTSSPQARRLEYGFVGTDAIGRTYNQGPLPHVRPALDRITPGFELALGEAAGF